MPALTQRLPLKTLLLQIRDNPEVRREEHASFCQFSGLAENQIELFNVFDQPDFKPEIVTGYDAVFIGGASEANVLKPAEYPFVNNCLTLINHCLEKAIPVFASCFGFQLAVLALGGEVLHDHGDFEMGSIPIKLRDAARQDPLFRDTENPFMAVSVHRQYAANLPDNCIELAYTEKCSHAFKVKDKPFWAFQFHPEVDKRVLIERLTLFRASYTEGAEHLDRVLSSAVETPASNALLKHFVAYLSSS